METLYKQSRCHFVTWQQPHSQLSDIRCEELTTFTSSWAGTVEPMSLCPDDWETRQDAMVCATAAPTSRCCYCVPLQTTTIRQCNVGPNLTLQLTQSGKLNLVIKFTKIGVLSTMDGSRMMLLTTVETRWLF